MSAKIVDQLITLFQEKGQGAYFGEDVSETEHALQCAYFAEKSGASPELVVAALLHDIGHLVHGLPEDIAEQGIDGKHEMAGAVWLKNYFDATVVSPVKLHVAAKRYLCAKESNYLANLSPSSQKSLELQGGPMSQEEQLAFEREPEYLAAVALRHWDDEAKIPGFQVPGLEHYRAKLELVLKK